MTERNNEEQIVKRTIKDSVFTDFFRMPGNLLELYKVLHPEDMDVTILDIHDITVENVLVDDIYNDLGFRISDRLIILVEAQSTWTVNIIIRALIYLVKTYKDYIDDNGLDIYKSTKVQIPKPELYVLYTGDRKTRPDEIMFGKEFFPDEKDISVDIKVKVLYGTGEAILETIKICKDKNVLKGYLESREKEVVDMLMTLFDEEQIMKNHDATLKRENQLDSIRSLMETLKLSAEQAMDALKIPAAEQSVLMKKI